MRDSLLHCGAVREAAAKYLDVSLATVNRDVALFKSGGLAALRKSQRVYQPVSDLDAHAAAIRAALEQQPARTIAELGDRIAKLTGVERKPTQVRAVAQRLGLKWRRVRKLPVPPKKNLAEHVADQEVFLKKTLQPALRAAVKGKGHVFFVDAAHFVHGSFLCCLWSFLPVYVRAASGRQRFNVLGAWDAVGRRLASVTNTTVVNQETLCELLRRIAALGLDGPVRLALDNAKYQRAQAVRALARKLGLKLVFLPP